MQKDPLSVGEDKEKLNDFCTALENGDTENVKELFSGYIRDHLVYDDETLPCNKESFYCDILAEIINASKDMRIVNMWEAGRGDRDILVRPKKQ